MEKLVNLGFVASTIYFSGVCNLQCKYCFQPKVSNRMSDVNTEIIDWISSGRLEDDLLKYFGEGLEYISLWGGEPSINLPYLVNRLESIYNKFENLKEISYSTNISTIKLAKNTESLLREVTRLNDKYHRNVIVDVQMSIDGPSEVNDKDRIGSSAISIMDNITYLLKSVVDLNPSDFRFSLKGTQSADTMKWMLMPNEKYGNNLIYHNAFFDDYRAKWREFCNYYPTDGGMITLVFPGHYTQEDGKRFAEISKFLNSDEYLNYPWKTEPIRDTQVSSRIKTAFNKTLKRFEFGSNEFEFLSCCSCSAGRSSLGITHDGKLTWCQTSFFFDDDTRKYIKDNNLITEFELGQGYKFSNFDNFVKDIQVVDIDDNLKVYRSLNLINKYWTNTTVRASYANMQIDSLALSGQISDIYREPRWKDLATAYFTYGGNACPADNQWEFGSVFISDNSHMKLVLNGAFEYIMETIKNESNNT